VTAASHRETAGAAEVVSDKMLVAAQAPDTMTWATPPVLRASAVATPRVRW